MKKLELNKAWVLIVLVIWTCFYGITYLNHLIPWHSREFGIPRGQRRGMKKATRLNQRKIKSKRLVLVLKMQSCFLLKWRKEGGPRTTPFQTMHDSLWCSHPYECPVLSWYPDPKQLLLYTEEVENKPQFTTAMLVRSKRNTTRLICVQCYFPFPTQEIRIILVWSWWNTPAPTNSCGRKLLKLGAESSPSQVKGRIEGVMCTDRQLYSYIDPWPFLL